MSPFRSINNNEHCKNNTAAAKRLVKVQKSKNTFPPNGPPAASVFPSDAERLGLSSLYVIKAKKKKRERERRGLLKLFVSALPRGGAESWRTER